MKYQKTDAPAQGTGTLSAGDGSREFKELYADKCRCFEWMMDEYAGNIYISDLKSYELLYLTKLHMKLFMN